VIAVKKLDGSTMHINEDLVERVEDGADGQSAVYFVNGSHMIVANDPPTVVEKIRREKATLLRRVFTDPVDAGFATSAGSASSGVARLSQVRER
jgi:uncharacterized protein YlzI (FlbEa/FlbD family)